MSVSGDLDAKHPEGKHVKCGEIVIAVEERGVWVQNLEGYPLLSDKYRYHQLCRRSTSECVTKLLAAELRNQWGSIGEIL